MEVSIWPKFLSGVLRISLDRVTSSGTVSNLNKKIYRLVPEKF